MENVEERAGIRAVLEWLLGLARGSKVVDNDREEGVEIGVYFLPEDVLRVRRIT